MYENDNKGTSVMTPHKKIIVTGGAGFIGSTLIRRIIDFKSWRILNLDKLTYAGNLTSLAAIEKHPNYSFVHADICDRVMVKRVFNEFQPDGIIHLAAESHVDRSIDRPADFMTTNILGTYTLLEVTKDYLKSPRGRELRDFRFHHVSTDEVYGSLGTTGRFNEESAYRPNSPYSASKASSDHLVRAWHNTYKLPFVMTHCSNNYGPFQHPEKLIPRMILNALAEKPLPIYGDGRHIRDWIFVDDNVDAILSVFERGDNGETYSIAGHCEKETLDVGRMICAILNEKRPRAGGQRYEDLISFVADRPGHDFRYSFDCTKIKTKLDWTPKERFDAGLKKTVNWYLDNISWCHKHS
jgi:dTDP-glucose 4,6-dehydratase